MPGFHDNYQVSIKLSNHCYCKLWKRINQAYIIQSRNGSANLHQTSEFFAKKKVLIKIDVKEIIYRRGKKITSNKFTAYVITFCGNKICEDKVWKEALKMVADCGATCAKYLLCLFNFVFFVSMILSSNIILTS